MRHLALILITSSLFTACVTEADQAIWNETKTAFSSEGRLFSSAMAEIKGEQVDTSNIAEKDLVEPNMEAEEGNQKPAEATTGR